MMNFQSPQLSRAILMPVVQGGRKMLLLTQLVKNQSLTSSAGNKQIIDKHTHIVNNSMSCIDLISCTNQNVIF